MRFLFIQHCCVFLCVSVECPCRFFVTKKNFVAGLATTCPAKEKIWSRKVGSIGPKKNDRDAHPWRCSDVSLQRAPADRMSEPAAQHVPAGWVFPSLSFRARECGPVPGFAFLLWRFLFISLWFVVLRACGCAKCHRFKCRRFMEASTAQV